MKNLILVLVEILFSEINFNLIQDFKKEKPVLNNNNHHTKYNFIKCKNGLYSMYFSSLEEETTYYKVTSLMRESDIYLSVMSIQNLLNLESIDSDTVKEALNLEPADFKKEDLQLICRVLACSMYHYVS